MSETRTTNGHASAPPGVAHGATAASAPAKPPKRASVFWTVAGVFLVAGLLGSLIQGLLAVAVLNPLQAREQRARAELAASQVAAELTATPALLQGGDALDSLLARHRAALGGRSGWIAVRTPDGAITTHPPGRERVVRDLDPVTGKTAQDRGPAAFRVETVARRELARGATTLGEVLVLRTIRFRGMIGPVDSRAVLLALPIAILVAGIAGLVTVRLLARRLRAIELLAARVAEGDLSARISDPRRDEIGQLAARLDTMADRLAAARDQLVRTESQRRQLFADITHELATPLTSIRGFAETLQDPTVPMSEAERTRYVRGIQDEAHRLDRLIRDLFELARLEAGAAPLEPERLDWVALCANTLARFEPRFQDAGLTLAWLPNVSEAWITADGHRLVQVLENLLANALRYVPRGGSVDVVLDKANGGYRLRVSDDGPGLAADELPQAFERFYRSPSVRGAVRNGDDGGSGLGLAIVREIVERHGGKARAEARAPQGLTIAVELPGNGTPRPAATATT